MSAQKSEVRWQNELFRSEIQSSPQNNENKSRERQQKQDGLKGSEKSTRSATRTIKRRAKKLVGGVPVNFLPSVEAILKSYDFDRDGWCFRQKAYAGPNLTKNEKRWNEGVAGSVAGYVDDSGYQRIRIRGQNCAVHRLIWKLEHGKDPEGFIDHINGMRDDNRIENLRDVTPTQNAMNAIRDRWNAAKKNRKILKRQQREQERLERQARVEQRERALLAKLKAKYEMI